MTTETFDFGKVTVEAVEYQDNGEVIQFGGNYTFAAEPTAPPRRLHTINVDGMYFLVDSEGDLDPTSNATKNVKMLEAFYERHERWKTFIFNSPTHGALNVRFERPFVLPKPLRGGSGLCPTITLRLEEQR